MRKKTSRETHSIISGRDKVIGVARKTRLIVKILAAFLVLTFAWLKLRGFPIPVIDSDEAATLILRSALILYYLSWVGITSDVDDLELVLIEPPNKGRLPITGVVMAAIITVVFGILCAVHTHRQFIFAFSGFCFLDFLGWRYVDAKLLRVPFENSRATYERLKDYTALEKLGTVKDLIVGTWHWWRFTVGGILIVVLIGLTFSDITNKIASYTGVFSRASFLSFAILVFIVFYESWHWVERIRSKISIHVIDN